MEIPNVLLVPLTVAALGGVGWTIRFWLTQAIEKRVAYNFDKQIENVRSDLRLKEAKIVALQSSALINSTSRQAALDQRRLHAVEEIWAASIRLRPLLMAVTMMQILKVDAVAKRTPTDAKLREVIKIMKGGDHKDKIADPLVEQQRPFVSPAVWSSFTTYRTVLIFAYVQIEILSVGIEHPEALTDASKVIDMVKATLPHRIDYLDQTGKAGIYLLTEELGELLHSSMQAFLEGRQADQDDLDRANRIISLANQFEAASLALA